MQWVKATDRLPEIKSNIMPGETELNYGSDLLHIKKNGIPAVGRYIQKQWRYENVWAIPEHGMCPELADIE